MKNIGQNNSKNENQSAKLALIAASINTLGDALGMIAAGLALEEEIKENNENNQNINNLQRQIDNLTFEINQIKKKMK